MTEYNHAKTRPTSLDDLVEMIEGQGMAISLLATEIGLQIGATSGDTGNFGPTTITWKKLARMRRAAEWAAHLV